MKYILVAFPGGADLPADELGGKTPLEVAKVPNLHFFAKSGRVGSVRLVPQKKDPSSDAVFLNLLGYDADRIYTGRGPLEAANLGLQLEENEVPFRMNFITESRGILADATAGGLSTKEARAMINYLNKKMASDFVHFYAGSEYRHIAVLKDSHGFEALAARAGDPQLLTGEKIDDVLPKGPGDELLKKLMYDARLLLQDHEINQVRVDLRENPANMIWLWGQGKMPRLEPFAEKYGLSGSMVSYAEYARGIARLAGLEAADMPDEVHNFEIDLEKKAKRILQELEEKDFVCCLAGLCDDASMQGGLRDKISALEAIDYFILSWVREYMETHKETRVLVTPCQTVSWKQQRPARDGICMFAMAGKNVVADEVEKFTELAARSAELKIPGGHELMESFLER